MVQRPLPRLAAARQLVTAATQPLTLLLEAKRVAALPAARRLTLSLAAWLI